MPRCPASNRRQQLASKMKPRKAESGPYLPDSRLLFWAHLVWATDLFAVLGGAQLLFFHREVASDDVTSAISQSAELQAGNQTAARIVQSSNDPHHRAGRVGYPLEKARKPGSVSCDGYSRFSDVAGSANVRLFTIIAIESIAKETKVKQRPTSKHTNTTECAWNISDGFGDVPEYERTR